MGREAARASTAGQREPNTRIVRAWPDTEPVEFNFLPCVYAYWITPEMIREAEEE
ncbi:hypothetical protein [Streptomyces sparsogenes]|uniref:hypothetical protein n=1 Tax=Streptomyces sparsogenes TaxID=67365 RepID=UPI00340CFA76